MSAGLEHMHFVALAYLSAAVVIVFLVLQSLFAAARAGRALATFEDGGNGHKEKDAAP